MLEIRGHARGGQGMVTAFEILAKIFGTMGGYYVQAFPAFGVERTGAPIQAFLRVSRTPILNRSNIYSPDLIVVFDETLLDQVPIFEGLKEDGAALINTERDTTLFKEKTKNVFTIPATRISIKKGLGSKALPIVNAAMIGAILKILDTDISIAEKIIYESVPTKNQANVESAQIAFGEVIGLDNNYSYLKNSLNMVDNKGETISVEEYFKGNGVNLKELPSIPYWSQPMSINKTGNWRVLTPEYTTKNAPCSQNCPAGTDVRGFVKLANEKSFKEAFELILEHNPFPAVCGRVCPNFCEQNCNRNELDTAVNIGSIERFLGDRNNDYLPEVKPITKKERIAVIGAGPAGLTAAFRLRNKGYETIVYEAMPKAGGMMRSGIPKFRLPDEALDKEIERIEKAGVKIKLNSRISVDDIRNEFDAVLVAVGSHKSYNMGIPNENLAIDGVEFLRKFKLESQDFNIRKGDNVAIIGGGNTAIDVARTVLRLGGLPTIYYRRTQNEMPAIAEEVEEAFAEGVKFEFLTAPVSLQKSSDNNIEATFIKMKLGELDDTGRRKPIPIDGSEYKMEINKIILAIGQSYDEFVFNGEALKVKQGLIDNSGNVPLFCAGDMAWGGTVTEAIGSGNKAAEEIDCYLRGIPYQEEDSPVNTVVPADINFAYYLPTPRIENRVKYDNDLFNNFEEVVAGLTEEQIVNESNRCLHCGECFSCGNCYNYCPDAAIHIDAEGRLRIDYDYCKGCGICYEECPCSAIEFKMSEVEYE